MKLNFEERGSAKDGELPLVLLHAFPLNGGMWRNQLEEIGKERRVIAVDFRGYGGTPLADEPFSFALFAGDVRDTMESLGLKGAVFGGCSMGGYTIFELWRQAPHLVRGMVLCDTRAEADTEEGRAKRREQIERLRERGADFMPAFVKQNLLGEYTRDKSPDIVKQVELMVKAAPVETIMRTLEALGTRPDSLPTLKTVDVPVLVIVGEEDTVTPLSAAEVLHHEIKGAQLNKISKAGHLSPLENPIQVNSFIRNYLGSL